MRDFALDPASAPCLGLEFVSGPKAGAKYEYDSGLSFDSDSIVLWIEDVMEAPGHPRNPSLKAEIGQHSELDYESLT